mgnify:CR=1 FL=1
MSVILFIYGGDDLHIEKYTRSAVGHILAHNEPTKARAQRENVDETLTHYNYNLVKGKGIDNLKKVLSFPNVRYSKRKDLNVMCSCVVSMPDNLPIERQREFFELTFQFLNNRYNSPCVSAYVHLFDEPSAKPHLHYDFVPLVRDEKNNGFKVCAKELITRKDLQTLHTDFKRFIDNCMGLDLEILNGSTSNGNKTILELKTQTLKDEIERLEKVKKQVQNEIDRELAR